MGNLELVWSLLLVVYTCSAASQPVGEETSSAASLTLGDERIVYDQRQTGKYNINLSIKDFAVIQIEQNDLQDESFDDEDYYYDEDHLTIKPIQLSPATTRPPPPPLATTTGASTTGSTTAVGIPAPTKHLTTTHYSDSGNTFSPNLLADLAATQAASSHAATQSTQSNPNPNSNSNASYTALTTTTTTTPALPTSGAVKKSPNVVIVGSTAPFRSSPTSTHLPPIVAMPADAIGRTKEIPILSAEALVHSAGQRPRQRYNALQLGDPFEAHALSAAAQSRAEPDSDDSHAFTGTGTGTDTGTDTDTGAGADDSKIYKFKMRRTHKLTGGAAAARDQSAPAAGRHTRARRCRSNQYRDVSGNCRIKRSSASILKKLFSMLVSLPFVDRERDQHDD